MFSNSQNHLEWTPRPNFAIIPPPFDITKTCPASHHPQNYPNTVKSNSKNTKRDLRFGKSIIQLNAKIILKVLKCLFEGRRHDGAFE